jgi:hypothetical protein
VSFIRDPFAEVPKPADYASICSGDTRPLFFIGVDANQNYLGDTDNNPATLNYGLTSMLKRVDMATYEVIRSVVEGNFKATLSAAFKPLAWRTRVWAMLWMSTTKPCSQRIWWLLWKR